MNVVTVGEVVNQVSGAGAEQTQGDQCTSSDHHSQGQGVAWHQNQYDHHWLFQGQVQVRFTERNGELPECTQAREQAHATH